MVASGLVTAPPPHGLYYQQEQVTLPLIPQLPPVFATTPAAATGTAPNLLVSAPPPPPPALPIPVFLSTPAGMVPYGQHAPVLTPWPPIPLRHIDSYLAGHWPTPHPHPPPPPLWQPSQIIYQISKPRAPPESHLSRHPINDMAAQQQHHFETDISSLPVQLGASAPPPSLPTAFFQPVHASATPVPLVRNDRAVAATTSTSGAAGQCLVQGCQAHPFCELSPCRCRICRDHLGWVMRGARLIDLETGDEVEPDQQQQPGETRKVYRCIACGWQSTMEPSANAAAGGGGPSPTKKTSASLHRKIASDDSVQSTGTSMQSSGKGNFSPNLTLTSIGREGANANAFSIHYFSHGPVSHPQPQPRPSSLPISQRGSPVNPVTWPYAGVGAESGAGGGFAFAFPELPVNPVAGLSGIPIDFSTMLDPVGDASAVPYVQMLSPIQQTHGLEGDQEVRFFSQLLVSRASLTVKVFW